ncbi:MAG: septum formation family protein [Candidatus Limnocylindria bacterium]
MNERWVCKRCFADNTDDQVACARCGLHRGSEVAPHAQAAWASAHGGPTGAERPQPAWRGLLRYWWVPALGLFLLIGFLASARRADDGSITTGGTLSIEELRVGDCFDSADEEEISEVHARPCDENHEYELFHIATWTGSDEFPSADEMRSFIGEECVPAFDEYVGLTYLASRLDFLTFSPVEEGWRDGDRIFQCALYDPAEPDLTASLRDASR